MEKYLFMGKVLPFFDDQEIARKVYAYFLRVMAVLLFFAAIVGFVELWKLAARLSWHQVPGCAVFGLLYIVAVYMVMHLLWLRSQLFLQLPEAEFHFIHAVELLIKTAGEVYLVYTAPLAVGGAFLVWFTGNSADYIITRLVPFAHKVGSYGATGGFLFMVGTFFSIIIVFTASRLIAELLVMVVDITMNLRFLRNHAEKK